MLATLHIDEECQPATNAQLLTLREQAHDVFE